jgi:hypothetical protein
MGAVLQSKESDPKLASAMLVISEPGDDLVIIDEVSTGQERCRNSAPRLRPGAYARGSQPYLNSEPSSRLQRDRGGTGALPLVGFKA